MQLAMFDISKIYVHKNVKIEKKTSRAEDEKA